MGIGSQGNIKNRAISDLLLFIEGCQMFLQKEPPDETRREEVFAENGERHEFLFFLMGGYIRRILCVNER